MLKKTIIIIFLLYTLIISANSITPINPQNNEEEVDLKTIFRWEVDNDYRYRFYISENEIIDESHRRANNLFSNFYAGAVLKPNTTYYWKIEAFNEEETIESEIFSFKTRNVEPGDMYSIFFGTYDNFIYHNEHFYASRNRRVRIYDLNQDVVKNISFDEDIKNVFLVENSLIYETEIYLYKRNE